VRIDVWLKSGEVEHIVGPILDLHAPESGHLKISSFTEDATPVDWTVYAPGTWSLAKLIEQVDAEVWDRYVTTVRAKQAQQEDNWHGRMN